VLPRTGGFSTRRSSTLYAVWCFARTGDLRTLGTTASLRCRRQGKQSLLDACEKVGLSVCTPLAILSSTTPPPAPKTSPMVYIAHG